MTAEMELKAEFIAVPSSLEQPGNPELTLALSEAIWFKKNYFSLKTEVTYVCITHTVIFYLWK